MGKYEPLAQFLLATSASEAPLTFRDIEKALGAPLPPSAFQYREWWANEKSHSQSKAWMKVGWQVWSVDLGGERVVFRRSGDSARGPGRPTGGQGAPAADGRAHLVIDLEDLTAAAMKAIDDCAADRGLDRAGAIAVLLNATGASQLERTFAWMDENGVKFDHTSSAELIRQDRDAR